MAPSPPQPEITQVLSQLAAGEKDAADRLLAMVYDELRGLARAQLGRAGVDGPTLQPTALVHDAYLRLVDEREVASWENRRHFFFAAGRAMRDLLVERARRNATDKRGGGKRRVDLDDLDLAAAEERPDDLLALEDALVALGEEDPRKRQLVELRFFAGLSMADTALAMNTPLRTLEREWRYTRAVLARTLAGDGSDVDEDARG